MNYYEDLTNSIWYDRTTRIWYRSTTAQIFADIIAILDELAIRLNDTEQQLFPQLIKFKALNRGQLELTKYIEDNFVPELQTIDSGLDCSGGEIDLSALTYTVLKDKILAVIVNIGGIDYWAIRIEPKELDRLENEYFYSDTDVFFYVQSAKIKIVAPSLVGATADVFYMKVPTEFDIYELSDLQSYFYNLILCLAENYCWTIKGDYDRAKTVKDMALQEIAILNKKYEEEQKLLEIGVFN
jgi:hypothetical protein